MTPTPLLDDSWIEIYRDLGYETEFNMLHDLYVIQRMGLHEIAGLLRKSTPTIRRHLLSAGIQPRRPGGPNHRGSKLAQIPDSALKNPMKAAVDHNVSPSSIYNEKRKRREATDGNKSREESNLPERRVDLHKDREDGE